MRNFLVTAAVVGALSFAGLGAAGAAAAVAFGGAAAADTVSIPRPEGLDNTAPDGRADSPLPRCAIANTNDLPVIESAGRRNAAGTLLVDFNCLP
jgi:hypothetical protein